LFRQGFDLQGSITVTYLCNTCIELTG